MTKASFAPGGLSLDGIEVVELPDIDLDFAVEEMFRKGASPTLRTTQTEPAQPAELGKLPLFRGMSGPELAELAARCQAIHAMPGYVVLTPGQVNTRVVFVIEGQLRLYARTGDKRPIAVADVGHSTGLRSALVAQPLNHAVIATEISYILAVDRAVLDEGAKRSHAFARNYAALLESYMRGDNCLHVGGQSPGGMAQAGYVDQLTLLHNQPWLDMVFPRLASRFRLDDRQLAVTAFAIDKLEEIIKQHGIGAGFRVLEAVGHWALDQTRPTDILAINKNRYIFAFLPECGLVAAHQLAERLKARIQSLAIALAPASASPPIKVTLSLAAAELKKEMQEDEFLGVTEALIQKSIKRGGNEVSGAQ